MKRLSLSLTIACVASLFAPTPSCAHAASSLTTPAGQKFRIDFLSQNDWIEINHMTETPVKILINLVQSDDARVPIAIFNQDGPAIPSIASVFKSTVSSRQMLFLIVRWHYYLPGVDTEGDYYEVHVYGDHNDNRGKLFFLEDRSISDIFGSGLEGKKEGKIVHFPFKNAASIRKKLSFLKLN